MLQKEATPIGEFTASQRKHNKRKWAAKKVNVKGRMWLSILVGFLFKVEGRKLEASEVKGLWA